MAYLKINRENLYHNLNQIALKTGSVDKIAIVLKDNAYGHGLKLIGELSSEYGIKTAVVRNKDEALEIYDMFDSIIVLNSTAYIDKKLRFTINSLEDLYNAQEGSNIDLKVDTGMHRNGIDISELEMALSLISKKSLNLVGVMTHYRSADELSSELFWQQKEFETVKEIVLNSGFTNIQFHSHNSATLFRQNSFNEDLARIGLAAYGYVEFDKSFKVPDLKPVKSLYAKKVSTRNIKKSQRVGYGGNFVATKDMTISTYDLGYGDGWLRSAHLKPFTLPNGLEILGRVSMDFISLESIEEEVCVMDDARVVAEYLNTIVYEVLISIEPKGSTLIMP